jgi:hypothetical protein
MTARELLSEYIYHSAKYTVEYPEVLPKIWAALKTAVIREASAGTVTFTKDGENSVIAFDGITHLEKISDTYFGSYHLIPKQTS